MADKAKDDEVVTAADQQPDIETPKEIATPRAAERESPSARADAMAAENASTATVLSDKERDARASRMDQMAAENAATMAPQSDKDREAALRRADQMAAENATA